LWKRKRADANEGLPQGRTTKKGQPGERKKKEEIMQEEQRGHKKQKLGPERRGGGFGTIMGQTNGGWGGKQVADPGSRGVGVGWGHEGKRLCQQKK